jgi:hypothetical protein
MAEHFTSLFIWADNATDTTLDIRARYYFIPLQSLQINLIQHDYNLLIVILHQEAVILYIERHIAFSKICKKNLICSKVCFLYLYKPMPSLIDHVVHLLYWP